MARRLRAVREELCGEAGRAWLADRLRLPPRTWEHCELGVTMPGEVLLDFIELTGVEPAWLLRGIGERYRRNT